MVIDTLAAEAVQGALLMVHRRTTGPAPPACVNVEAGDPGLENVPVPPLTTLQEPLPMDGVLPPSAAVVPPVQIVCGPPVVAVVGGWLMVMLVLAVEAVHGALLIVHRTTTGPAPPVCVNVALGEVALEKVPVPPLTTLQAPVPTVGMLPPSPEVVPFKQMVCGPPVVATVGGWLIVIVTSADVAVHGALLIVHLTTTGPAPPVCVNVAFAVEALENVPVPPLTTLQAPVPIVGVLPPSPVDVPFVQIVWAPPAVAGEGGWLMVTVTSAVVAVHGALLIVQRRTTGPVPPVCVNVELGRPAFANEPVPPPTMLHAPVPDVGVLPPSPVVVPPLQMVWGPPVVAVLGAGLIVMVTFAVDAVQGALLMVQRTITGPVPPVWVNVEEGEAALEKVPVPPLTTLHAPVPVVGVLAPSPVVVPPPQIDCAPPTVATLGG